jgi:phosphate starvation-inducible membrane PsiE
VLPSSLASAGPTIGILIIAIGIVLLVVALLLLRYINRGDQ